MKRGSLDRKVGCGRPRKTTARDDKMIIRQVKKDRECTSIDIKRELGLDHVSDKLIRRRIAECSEFKSYWKTRKFFVSEKNRKLRVKWCKEHLKWTPEQWRKVIWTDESPYVLRFNKKTRVWRSHNERYEVFATKATVKHDKKINVWGAFSAHGVGRIHKIEGIMNAPIFHDILVRQATPTINELFPGRMENGLTTADYLFQQDNDPKHTARINIQYQKNKGYKILPWPSQSPDLNPIENLWSILEDRMKDRKPQNEEQLFECIKTAWESVPLQILGNLVDFMPRRCALVIKNKGRATKY